MSYNIKPYITEITNIFDCTPIWNLGNNVSANQFQQERSFYPNQTSNITNQFQQQVQPFYQQVPNQNQLPQYQHSYQNQYQDLYQNLCQNQRNNQLQYQSLQYPQQIEASITNENRLNKTQNNDNQLNNLQYQIALMELNKHCLETIILQEHLQKAKVDSSQSKVLNKKTGTAVSNKNEFSETAKYSQQCFGVQANYLIKDDDDKTNHVKPLDNPPSNQATDYGQATNNVPTKKNSITFQETTEKTDKPGKSEIKKRKGKHYACNSTKTQSEEVGKLHQETQTVRNLEDDQINEKKCPNKTDCSTQWHVDNDKKDLHKNVFAGETPQIYLQTTTSSFKKCTVNDCEKLLGIRKRTGSLNHEESPNLNNCTGIDCSNPVCLKESNARKNQIPIKIEKVQNEVPMMYSNPKNSDVNTKRLTRYSELTQDDLFLSCIDLPLVDMENYVPVTTNLNEPANKEKKKIQQIFTTGSIKNTPQDVHMLTTVSSHNNVPDLSEYSSTLQAANAPNDIMQNSFSKNIRNMKIISSGNTLRVVQPHDETGSIQQSIHSANDRIGNTFSKHKHENTKRRSSSNSIQVVEPQFVKKSSVENFDHGKSDQNSEKYKEEKKEIEQKSSFVKKKISSNKPKNERDREEKKEIEQKTSKKKILNNKANDEKNEEEKKVIEHKSSIFKKKIPRNKAYDEEEKKEIEENTSNSKKKIYGNKANYENDEEEKKEIEQKASILKKKKSIIKVDDDRDVSYRIYEALSPDFLHKRESSRIMHKKSKKSTIHDPKESKSFTDNYPLNDEEVDMTNELRESFKEATSIVSFDMSSARPSFKKTPGTKMKVSPTKSKTVKPKPSRSNSSQMFDHPYPLVATASEFYGTQDNPWVAHENNSQFWTPKSSVNGINSNQEKDIKKIKKSPLKVVSSHSQILAQISLVESILGEKSSRDIKTRIPVKISKTTSRKFKNIPEANVLLVTEKCSNPLQQEVDVLHLVAEKSNDLSVNQNQLIEASEVNETLKYMNRPSIARKQSSESLNFLSLSPPIIKKDPDKRTKKSTQIMSPESVKSKVKKQAKILSNEDIYGIHLSRPKVDKASKFFKFISGKSKKDMDGKQRSEDENKISLNNSFKSCKYKADNFEVKNEAGVSDPTISESGFGNSRLTSTSTQIKWRFEHDVQDDSTQISDDDDDLEPKIVTIGQQRKKKKNQPYYIYSYVI